MFSSRRILRVAALALLVACASGFRECYKPVTKSGLPAHVRTIGVPPLQNTALRYKVESRFTEAVMDEIIRRGKGLRVQAEREGADAVVEGVIKDFFFSGVLLDSRGRARIFEVTVTAAVTVRDQVRNRVIYDNQNFVFRGEFEFTDDPRSFFNEEDPAARRIARAFSESLVSTLVHGLGADENK